MAVWEPKADATYAHTVESWDTPYVSLESDVASFGMRVDVREPHVTYAWSGSESSFLENVSDAAETTPANLFAAFTNATHSTALITDGRAPNVLEYWSAGSPNWYAASQRGRVAIHYRLVLRPVAGRSWFSNAGSVTLSLAFAGQGFVRCTKTVSGTTTELQIGATETGAVSTTGFVLAEADWLEQGYRFTDVVTLAAGDALDIYYVQDREEWGGLVAKAVLGSTRTNALAAAAPVAGCGLFDTGTQPTTRAWKHVQAVRVEGEQGVALQSTISVPLVNPNLHDGFGFEWRQDNEDDPGHLVCWDGGTEQFEVRRGRLVRVKMGYSTEEEVVATGIIQDCPRPKGGMAQVRVLGFEHRLIESRSKLEPDPISYMAAGYRKLTGAVEPMYGITAYDAWTIEDAVADMAYRAGIDASRMRQPLKVRRDDGSFVQVSYGGEDYRKFRARSKAGLPLRLERPVHYGNVGTKFTEAKPEDDPYIFAPESRDDSWLRVLEISDRYGYDIRFDPLGDLVLSTRDNACFAYDIVAGDSAQASTRLTQPSAYKGTYQEWAVACTVEKTVTGARIDASLPRGPGLGAWTSITVTRVSDSQVVATHNNVDVSTGVAASTFYYDFRTDPKGQNATLLTLFSGDYDDYLVTFTGTGAATRRLDTLFVYHSDPQRPAYALDTLENAISVDAHEAGDEMRNLVTVVGRRKAAVTDSEKLLTNPNNPDPEFIVEVAVDAASISDPTAKNYVGMRREAVLIDDRITDQDYAAYLARTMIFRYRTPKPPADIEHTLIAELQFRACLTANEATYQSVSPVSKLWVTGYVHEGDALGRYVTTIRTSAWPEFPSYEPRDDIDIDADFDNVPITNVEVSYMGLSGTAKTNLPGTGVVLDSSYGSNVVMLASLSVQAAAGDQPAHLQLPLSAAAPWPPVPGTLAVRPTTGGTSATSEEYPSGLGNSIASTGVVPNFPDNSGIQPYFIPLQHKAQQITSITATVWFGPLGGTRFRMGTFPVTDWSYDPDRNLVTARVDTSKALSRRDGVSFTVSYTRYSSTTARTLKANNPYHHFLNVDHRDAQRRVYLPWKQADGSSAYQRDTNVTAYDVIYRKLGNADGSGNYSAFYTTGSPFYDVTSSELGHLVTLKFDALVSGHYRISVRSAYDHTRVAYLTESTADPQEPEAHWQYITAGAARAFNWDGVDQVGQWNRRQSEDYSAVSQGWFGDDEKQAIGAGWYVWNREFEGGAVARLGLISDERSADGTPVYGQAAYAQWYFEIECRNEALAAVAEADVTGNPRLRVPRVVRTIEASGAADLAPSYTTAAEAAVVYTHMPAPAQLELEVDDWAESFAYDPSDNAHQADSHWRKPWYGRNLALDGVTTGSISMSVSATGWVRSTGSFVTDGFVVGQLVLAAGFANAANNGVKRVTSVSALTLGFSGSVVEGSSSGRSVANAAFEGLINNDNPVRVRFRVAPRAGALWSGRDGDAQVKLTRQAHLKAVVHDQFVVGEGSNWPGTGVERRTAYSRRLHNDDHTIAFVDEGWRKADTLRNSQNTSGVTQWVFRPDDFRKDFRGAEDEPLQFGDYLQLEEVPKWEQQRTIASAHSRLNIAFMAYLFYLSAYCVDRTGRRTWGINRNFVDRSKITGNAYADWWSSPQVNSVAPHPTDDQTAPVAGAFKAELPYDPVHQQRRTVVCRQWTNEGTWVADQTALWNLASGTGVGAKLLRHLWKDHDPVLSATLNGAAWPTLDLDNHSRWHTDGRAELPAAYGTTLTRQLGTNIATRLGLWTWEGDPSWVPCVGRDWHPYFLLPPMPDRQDEASLNWYAVVDVRTYNAGDNTGRDVAAAQTWSSWARDMSRAYQAGNPSTAKVRFWPGTQTDTTKGTGPGGVEVDSLDYVRQDDTVHFEDLRGLYSRGARPAEQPKKGTPSSPYYVNQLVYDLVEVVAARGVTTGLAIPKFKARVLGWFHLGYRTEYLWESSSFFPVDEWGRERLDEMNVWKSGYIGQATSVVEYTGPNQVAYDGGAWTGWKDSHTGLTQTNVFETGYMPFDSGPRLGTTADIWMHMVLTNERRQVPL